MRIEKATVEDAQALLSIYAPYVRNTAITFEYDVPTLEEFRSRIQSISAKYPYLKAVEDGEIVGYAYATAFRERKAYGWAVENTVYVKQDWRRHGIGKALYTELERILKNMGILNMIACIAVPAKDEDAHLTYDSCRFHTSMGFALAGRFHNIGYKFNTWYDMIWMEKMLGEHTVFPAEVRFGDWTI